MSWNPEVFPMTSKRLYPQGEEHHPGVTSAGGWGLWTPRAVSGVINTIGSSWTWFSACQTLALCASPPVFATLSQTS